MSVLWADGHYTPAQAGKGHKTMVHQHNRRAARRAAIKDQIELMILLIIFAGLVYTAAAV